jgi:hypothetical protein
MTDEEALRIKSRHGAAILARPDVHAISIQTAPNGQPRLVVRGSLDASQLPTDLEGLPVVVEKSGPFKAQ